MSAYTHLNDQVNDTNTQATSHYSATNTLQSQQSALSPRRSPRISAQQQQQQFNQRTLRQVNINSPNSHPRSFKPAYQLTQLNAAATSQAHHSVDSEVVADPSFEAASQSHQATDDDEQVTPHRTHSPLHKPSNSYDAKILAAQAQVNGVMEEFQLEESDSRSQSLLSGVTRRFPVKTAAVALLLLMIGLACLIIAIIHFATGVGSSFGFFLLGALLVLPGGYQSYRLLQACRGVEGYSFGEIAPYEV